MDTSNPALIDSVSSRRAPNEAKRRHRSLELKRQIVEETLAPGASVARVARAHGVNANQVFAWRRQYRQGLLGSGKRGTPGLLAVRVAEAGAHASDVPIGRTLSGTIQIELPKGLLQLTGSVDMGRLLEVAKAVRADTVEPSAGERESKLTVRTPNFTPSPEKGASKPPHPTAAPDFAHRLDAAVEPVGDLLTGMVLPTRRCSVCNSWLYWVSVYRVVVCASCHPPSIRNLVRTFYWLPEGECRKTQ